MNNNGYIADLQAYYKAYNKPKHENYLRVLNLRKSQCYLSES